MSELKLPELGENIEEALVSSVLVAVGDVVRPDQPVIEVETEKASLEVPSTIDGRVAELRVSTGDKVSVGQVILVVESEGAATAEVAAPAPKVEAAAPGAIPGRARPASGREMPESSSRPSFLA